MLLIRCPGGGRSWWWGWRMRGGGAARGGWRRPRRLTRGVATGDPAFGGES